MQRAPFAVVEFECEFLVEPVVEQLVAMTKLHAAEFVVSIAFSACATMNESCSSRL